MIAFILDNPFLSYVIFAFAFVFIGYFIAGRLRAGGFGPQLDAAAAWIDKSKAIVTPVALSGAFNVMRTFNKLPLYSSRRHRADLAKVEEFVRKASSGTPTDYRSR